MNAQLLTACTRRCARRLLNDLARRSLSSAASPSSSTAPPSIPWFVDPAEYAPQPPSPAPSPLRHAQSFPPLPAALPPSGPIARLHAALAASPHIEPGMLVVREPVPTPLGPPLPEQPVKGRRRRRGVTNSGEGIDAETGGIWSWIVLAQVKEGTENRGAIESVVRIVRKTLLTATPPLPIPPNLKRRYNGEWAMIDAGEFAVHILGREAREKYFPNSMRKWTSVPE
ncbi:hypothetical protein OBBRIDRAFT_813317 [Obba rivulosa]|uniref:Uncharacterized protein n=1 Tax=Obba rivulosa TaxID=1052685 RepID=A0A8E2DJJ8_9APHY|nr:hypothetical protein OBBRIDRAFT_813317 [Obba rivulosa]